MLKHYAIKLNNFPKDPGFSFISIMTSDAQIIKSFKEYYTLISVS
jgi:hypothetical protein